MISLRHIALIPLALVVASCSSGSSKSTAPSTAASTAPAAGASTSPSSSTPGASSGSAARAAYLAKVNGLCDTMNARVQALGTPTSDPVAAANLNDKAIAITTEMLGKIRAVPPPPGESAAVAAIYAKVDVMLGDARALSTAMRSGDQSAAQTAETKLDADSHSANDASNAFGLSVCGS